MFLQCSCKFSFFESQQYLLCEVIHSLQKNQSILEQTWEFSGQFFRLLNYYDSGCNFVVNNRHQNVKNRPFFRILQRWKLNGINEIASNAHFTAVEFSLSSLMNYFKSQSLLQTFDESPDCGVCFHLFTIIQTYTFQHSSNLSVHRWRVRINQQLFNGKSISRNATYRRSAIWIRL